ncbi:hypothetical protein BK654_06825 [Pseudomonas brassicacearum]|uniref:hypothetical protein n=1 Tax=Pseudomonas brassicacearum TaxID=930166 RepID=UPI000F495A9D|nr:hypothetical protein [Pseudomonas brassicacearum]ROM79082.1 hypothetical protein BK654_06825 [Pseudomonas brassicacearum]
MTELKSFFFMLESGLVCMGLLLAILVALKLRVANAASLFIWGCSVPVTVFSYAAWIYASGGDKWSPTMLFIEIFLLAQLGWLGGGLAFLGMAIKEKSNTLKRAGLWISIVSVAGHGLFIGMMLILGSGS